MTGTAMEYRRAGAEYSSSFASCEDLGCIQDSLNVFRISTANDQDCLGRSLCGSGVVGKKLEESGIFGVLQRLYTLSSFQNAILETGVPEVT